MNALRKDWRRRARGPITAFAGTLWLVACAPTPEVPDEVIATRAELARLQADTAIAPLVSRELADAEAAVQLAEQEAEAGMTAHRVYMAQREIEIARATGEARLAEQERQALVSERENARLQARTREADAARMEADAARSAAAAAQQEIDALNAQQTDRGLVLTLGDVLFETGKADLKAGAVSDLDRLVDFLGRYPERTALVEGHTDSVGGDAYNRSLSQSRAEAVRGYLVRRGVPASRVVATGMGESAPVASNNNEAGRQQNRRVEIIISNDGTMSPR